MFRNLPLCVFLIVILLACDDKVPDQVKEELPKENPITNKDNFLKGLSAVDRFWRFETLTVQYRDSTVTADFKQADNKLIPWAVLHGPIHNMSLRFSGGLDFNRLTEIISSGPYGNVKYPHNANMWSTVMGITEDGKWAWNDERSTVTADLPGSIKSIIKTASNQRFEPKQGHLESAQPLLFTSLSEALEGGTPERIKFIINEKDQRLGYVRYVLSLRGAWIRKSIPGGRQAIYEVTY